jgi:tetratricopeptide (TPR) repeat protein
MSAGAGAGGAKALLVAALLAGSAFGVSRMQPALAKTVHDVKQRDDVYVLPPPAELRGMTLGYHAAAVDLLWAKLLVEYGTHWQEKRSFDASNYLDAILAIEPTYAPVYKFADTLLVYRPPRGYEADARKARAYLERGLKERPGDYEVWQEYGQYMAFMGPSFLESQADKDEWRKIGAQALMHAVELGADPERSVAAATILRKSGERDQAIKHLNRILHITEDPQTRQEIAAKLDQLGAQNEAEDAQRAVRFIESRWHSDYSFLSIDAFMLIGPPVDVARCAGPASADDVGVCARDWGPVFEAQGIGVH